MLPGPLWQHSAHRAEVVARIWGKRSPVKNNYFHTPDTEKGSHLYSDHSTLVC